MRIEQLHYIIEIAKQKSISKAAKNLYISQPSLSKAVSQLEAELDTPIFVRLQQGVIPTTKGEIIIAKAQTVLDEIAGIKATASEDISISSAPVFTVGLPLLLCDEIFTQINCLFAKQFPSLTVIPYQYTTMDTIRDLRNNSLDLGIISYSGTEKEQIEMLLRAENIFMQILSQEPFCIVTHCSSHWRQYQTVPLNALSTAQIITFSDILRFSKDETFLPELSTPNYMPNKEALFSTLAKQTEAITILPRCGALVNTALHTGEFIAIPIDDFPNTQYICSIFNSDRAIPPHVQAFVDLFADFYQQWA